MPTAVTACWRQTFFAGAYNVANRRIPVGASPADIGGYVLHLADAFYRIWATAGPYHIEIDTMGQSGQDATGLGRIHKRGVPIETGLNMSIVSSPSYIIPIEKAGRAVALGAGWPHEGDWRYLSSANRETHQVHCEVSREDQTCVEFTVTYQSKGEGLRGATLVQEHYALRPEGLRCTIRVPGAPRLRLQVPVIATDGKLKSDIAVGVGQVQVRYEGHTYLIRVPNCETPGTVEPWLAPNRNGIHRVVVFEMVGPTVSYEASLQ